jgi:hypothetical protein
MSHIGSNLTKLWAAPRRRAHPSSYRTAVMAGRKLPAASKSVTGNECASILVNGLWPRGCCLPSVPLSLTPQEFIDIVRIAVDTCRGKIPIVAGAGGATRMAIAHSQEAQRLGAQGVLLLPHYLTEASQQGLVSRACRSGLPLGYFRFDCLQPRLVPPQPRRAGTVGRTLPEPGRLQGRTRGHRADGETECLQTLITAQEPHNGGNAPFASAATGSRTCETPPSPVLLYAKKITAVMCST